MREVADPPADVVGLEPEHAAQRSRARPALDGVRLVALTGFGAPADISAARAAGFEEYVIKPAELAMLERILASRKATVFG